MERNASVSAVTLGTLVDIVAAIHGVTSDRMPALKGRFRNFSKFGFPDVRQVGTGTRAEYWPEHVALTLLAFELVRYRMPQSAIAQGVLKQRDIILGAFGEAGSLVLKGDAHVPVQLIVRSNALLEDAKRPELADVTFSRGGDSVPEAASQWSVDAVRLVSLAVAAAARTDEPLDAGFFARITKAGAA